MSNVLRKLTERLRIRPEMLARATGRPLEQMRAVLAESPTGDVAAFLAAARALGVRWSVEVHPDVSVTVPWPAVDRLYRDNAWRRAHKLLEIPSTKRELRRMVGQLKKNRSYQQLADVLNRGWVGTMHGGRVWRRAGLHSMLQVPPDRTPNTPLPVSEELRDAWRRYAASVLIVDLCWWDAAACVRHQLTYRIADDGLVLAGKKMAAPFVKWLEAGVAELVRQSKGNPDAAEGDAGHVAGQSDDRPRAGAGAIPGAEPAVPVR